MAEYKGFTFGDFNFAAPHPQPQPQSQSQSQSQSLSNNGGLTSTAQDNDDEWGDFFVAPSSQQPSLSNAFSLSPQQSHLNNNPKPSYHFDPFSFGSPDPSPIRADPGPNTSQNPRGKEALPLSLFDSIDSGDKSYSNGVFDPNFPAQNGKIKVIVVSNGGGFNNNGDVFGNLNVQSQQIKPGNIGSVLNSGGSVSDLNNNLDDDGDEEDDEWEFTGAFPANGNQELGASVLSKVEPVVVGSQEKQAGQDVSSSAEHKHGSDNSVPQFVDLFAAYQGTFHKSNETDVGLNSSCTTLNANGFMPNLFHGVEAIVNGSGISATPVDEDDDFDDFGDFVDASQGGPQKQDQCIPDNTEAQLPNGKIEEDHQIQAENSRGPLPLSLFSDGLDEPSDGLTHQDEMFDKPTSNPRNGVSTQGLGVSIHDLLTNLYSQAQQTSSLDSNTKRAENGAHSPQNPEDSTPYVGDDDWDDNSWEFKDAFSETGVNEQSSSASPGTMSQKPSDTTSNLQFYMDFYAKLRGSLCVLLSHQLNEEKKSPSSDTIGTDGKAEALSHDIQEAYRLLEGNITTEEYLSKKHLDRERCLTEVFEALQGPKCEVIESKYSLSERLQMAMNDRRSAAELLKHAISVLQILSLGSADEQSVYVSIWSKIISVCAQELKHGALIWKRALEKNVQAQVLSDLRGQRYIQALGEIYKIIELLRLSTKLYKPWMCLSVSDPEQLFGLLEECASLWSSSGLEEALQNVSDYVGLGHKEATKALIVSIDNICDVDVLALHDSVFVQRQSICRLSLLPQEMLSDLKVAIWNKVPYFVNLANLWANLISPDPPQLPLLQVS